MSFMMQIDDARAALRSPLDLIVEDYFLVRSGQPSIDFCCRVFGVSDSDEVVARRLSVAISTVRGWRDVGRRARRWTCQ